MNARIHDIEAKLRELPLAVVGPGDFRTRDAGPVDPAVVLARPDLSLYCLDHAGRRALFVECDDPAAVLRAPFLYQAQYEAARRIVAVPYDALAGLVERAPAADAAVTLVFSVGRCGSTLLGRAFAAVPGALALSEPDVYSQLIGLRAAGELDDRGLMALLAGCTRLLCAAGARAGARAWAIKFRSEVTPIAGALHRALPEARVVYLYREGASWARSAARAYGVFAPDMAGELPGIVRDAAALDPIFAELVARACTRELALAYLAASWAASLLHCRALQAAGVPLFVLRYEELLADPYDVLGAMFDACGLPRPAEAALAAVLREDAQAGTVLSRESVERGGGGITRERLAAFAALVAELAPGLTPEALLPGTFVPRARSPQRCHTRSP